MICALHEANAPTEAQDTLQFFLGSIEIGLEDYPYVSVAFRPHTLEQIERVIDET